MKKDIIYSTECVEFYSNFMKYKNIYHHDYAKVFKFSVFKDKIDNKNNNVLSMYEFRSYMENVNHIDWIEESDNDESNIKSTAIFRNDESNYKSTSII